MKFTAEKLILPSFPRTPHLPCSTNLDTGDIVASNEEIAPIFTGLVNIEEKIDGASVGMTTLEEYPLIRNRDHILRKGYFKDTSAKKQFSSIWTWFYKNKKRFAKLKDAGPYSIYGEWCVAQHGIYYTKLPDWFIAYDIFDYEKKYFLSPVLARQILSDCGFATPTLFHQGMFDQSEMELVELSNLRSEYTEGKLEGIYIKVYDDNKILQRFKLVRSDFERGAFWNHKKMKRNEVIPRQKS